MPIPGIPQPHILPAAPNLRLRRFEGEFAFAFDWYQDPELVWLVGGQRTPYPMETVEKMYRYLDARGELYFIEILEETGWKPIGDVTFWRDDLPIVLGDRKYRGRHIGRTVLSALIQRGRELGYSRIFVDDIYDYNTGSRKCFESAGFQAYQKTEKGSRFYLDL